MLSAFVSESLVQRLHSLAAARNGQLDGPDNAFLLSTEASHIMQSADLG